MDGPQGYYVKLKVRPRKTYTVRAHLYVESKNKNKKQVHIYGSME